ncbi:2OG-Fe(II) oxygenase [Formicincola oecophyllae]|uniref:2OG-Fe(II) oxygenase n=1 Tax=Formicincola oecophyllae TaxID=2558361 RepID=A0A4Y6UA59_9PROT|nr:2OG-Fe(II) oxygenase [Formicincola oecophyllae]QDH13317.1 2OG-Fe(II) oxygenase [Formicincola oecophyllae]
MTSFQQALSTPGRAGEAALTPHFAAVRQAHIMALPTPHLVVPDFLSPEQVLVINREMPTIPAGGSYPPGALKLTPTLERFLQVLEGPELKAIIGDKFGLDVHQAPTMLTLRGHTRPQDGRIHRDSPCKRVTILLYLNPPEREFMDSKGCLRFLNGEGDMDNYAREILPTGGTLVVFPNGPDSWHGHLPHVGPRLSIQLNYMTGDIKARYEIFRHHLSAVWKRFKR